MMSMRLWLHLVQVLVLSTSLCLAGEATREANIIVEAAGARQGLCIHLGCGRAETPGLIAELAESSGFLVHGLALDDDALARARKAIDAKGMAGRASVERASLNPLPYLNDLARVVVVEDLPALKAQGLTQVEILRVTSPNGTLLIREGGQWTKSIKPMPKKMDEWTHPQHGADGNQVSTDSTLTLPVGLRWQDGLPVVAAFRAGTGACVAAGGRVFTAGADELENLSVPPSVLAGYTDAHGQSFSGYPQYLTARDAFSGIPLWKINLGSFYEGGAGNWLNNLPLAASNQRVYAAGKESLIIADAGNGKILAECKTKYTPARILLLENVVVAAGWAKRSRRDGDWVWQLKAASNVAAGSVEAFEADSGRALWSLETNVFRLVASTGVVYLEIVSGDPPVATEVAALDLKSGKELWRVTAEKLGSTGELFLGSAGPGVVTVVKAKEKTTVVLSAADGKERFHVSGHAPNTIPWVDGLLWLNGKEYDPESGAIKGDTPIRPRDNGCQQTNLTSDIVLCNWGMALIHANTEAAASLPSAHNRKGFRPACVMSWIPAYGMAYTPENPCRCVPGAVFGFTAVGPAGDVPSPGDFEKARPTEKGPAFGRLMEATPGSDEWPTFRHDTERSAATTAKLPERLKELWRTSVVTPGDDILSKAWRSLCTPLVSAPVIQDGLLFVSVSDLGQVAALDAATGKPAWTSTLGSRLTGPPSLYRGLCVIGCHDGWVYALRASDGQLAWRTRIAPWERRMVAFGRVESVWPAAGPVLIHDNVIFATAGRTSEAEGGVAMTALDPATGALIWGKSIGPGPQRVNDTLALRDGMLAWHFVRFDPRNGTRVAPLKYDEVLSEATPNMNPMQGAMIDAAWTVIPNHRRSGNAYMVGNLYANQLAWNDKTVVSPRGSIPREKTQNAGKNFPADHSVWQYTWLNALAPQQRVEALVLTPDDALYAGSKIDPATKKTVGFFCVVSLETGKKVAEYPLECPPACDGLAVVGEKVYLSLANGQILCFGK
jgi:outer membrane protein assembly factor BamB